MYTTIHFYTCYRHHEIPTILACLHVNLIITLFLSVLHNSLHDGRRRIEYFVTKFIAFEVLNININMLAKHLCHTYYDKCGTFYIEKLEKDI